MRILYLTQYFPPEFGAAAARAHSMTRWLARFGHEVTALTAFPNYLLDEIPAAYRGKRWVEEDVDGVTVRRAWLYTSSRRSNWRRMANYLSFMASSWWYGRRLPGPFDVVIATSPPLFLGLSGVALARRFHAPLVFDVRDMWPEIAVKLGTFRPGSLMERSWGAMADYTYRRAAAIIPVTTGMQKEMISRGLPAEKLHLIPNGVDLELIQTDAPDMRQELHLDGKFVVLFAGLIGVMQGVEVIVDAARLLHEREDVQFLIVGDGIEKTKLMKRVHELGLKNLTFFPKQSQDNLPRFINTANICLATLANREVKGVVPYKMLEAWAYRRPVVLTDDDEAADLIRTCLGGIATPPGDARALADAILQLEADRARARQMGENGRRCIEEKLNREQLARKMESVLLAVTRQAGNAAS